MPPVYIDVPCEGCGAIRTAIESRPSHWPKRLCARCSYDARTRPLAERFWEKVDLSGPVPPHRPELGACHSLSAELLGEDYRAVWVDKYRPAVGAHVIAWFLHYGVWPTLCICQLCDNRTCVRWDHLFEGTHKDNAQDMVDRGKHPIHWYTKRIPIATGVAWEIDWSHPSNTGTHLMARNPISRIPSARGWKLTNKGHLRSAGVNLAKLHRPNWEINWGIRNGKSVWGRNESSKMPSARDWHWIDYCTVQKAGIVWVPAA